MRKFFGFQAGCRLNIRSYLYGMGLKNLLDIDNNVYTLVYGNLTLELR